MYRFGIPSYKRCERQLTIETLHKLGYSRDNIVISVQTENDFHKYRSAYSSQANIIFRPATNCAQNRNNLIDYFDEGERFVMLDDDVKAFCRLEEVGDRKVFSRLTTKTELDKTLSRMFKYSRTHRSPMWAWYPVPNAFFMSNTIDRRNLFVGTIIGIENSRRLRFDETFSIKEDYEISLRLMQMGYNAIRFNAFTVEANHRSKGGCEEARAAGRNIKNCADLLERYPTLIKPSNRKGEVRFTGNRKKKGGSRK